jgi:glycerol-3-phosphate dehydrogenase
VFLCERGDLSSGTSSASTKLIHGGLRYLENHEFRLVHEALLEREVLWGIAPHIIWQLRFVLPHHKRLRPMWLLRLGLFIYDHLGGRDRLPPTRTLNLRNDPAGEALKPEFTRGFAYSDCWVEDSRLVVLNARDAAEHGATIAPRTACVSAEQQVQIGQWIVALSDLRPASAESSAKSLVKQLALGPWSVTRRVRLPLFVWSAAAWCDGCMTMMAVTSSECRRPGFLLIPYERDFTLVGDRRGLTGIRPTRGPVGRDRYLRVGKSLSAQTRGSRDGGLVVPGVRRSRHGTSAQRPDYVKT